MVVGTYVFICFYEFRNSCSIDLTGAAANGCYDVRDPLDLAVVAAAAARRLRRLPLVERAPGHGSSWVTPARWPWAD